MRVPYNYNRKREYARDNRAYEWQQKKFKVVHSASWKGGMVTVGKYTGVVPDARTTNDFGKPMGFLSQPKSRRSA